MLFVIIYFLLHRTFYYVIYYYFFIYYYYLYFSILLKSSALRSILECFFLLFFLRGFFSAWEKIFIAISRLIFKAIWLEGGEENANFRLWISLFIFRLVTQLKLSYTRRFPKFNDVCFHRIIRRMLEVNGRFSISFHLRNSDSRWKITTSWSFNNSSSSFSQVRGSKLILMEMLEWKEINNNLYSGISPGNTICHQMSLERPWIKYHQKNIHLLNIFVSSNSSF